MALNLKQKLYFAVLVTFACISMLFFAIFLPVQKHRLYKSYESISLFLETVMERDNEEIANEIFDHRINALEMRLNQITQIDGVVRINVLDSTGMLLAKSGPAVQSPARATEIIRPGKESKSFKVQRIKNDFLYIKNDIDFLGERVGSIEIYYSLVVVNKDQRFTLLLFSAAFMVLLLGSLTVLNFLLSQTIIKPIELLNASFKKIAAGEYDKSLTLQRRDEIGMLAISFDSMRASIKEQIERLQVTQNIVQRRESQLSLLTDNMADVISQTDPHTHFIYISPSAKKVLGYDPEYLTGRLATDLVHPDDVQQMLQNGAQARQARKETYLSQYRWQHANGDYIWVESSTRMLYTESGEFAGAVFSTRDISERVRLQEERNRMEKQLYQSQKLESIGLLAGGVAHDLNNLLSPILGYTELLLSAPDTAGSVKEKLGQIHKAGIGARDLVRQLLAFGRKQTLDYKPLNINRTIREYTEFIRRTIPEDIDIQFIQSDRVTPIMADHGQIEQVIMNLVVNASDSMPDGGKLCIETDMVTLDDEYAAEHLGVVPGYYLMMSVTDTGSGMDEKTLSQVFEPFFTTKSSQGTGLGLATVYGIVKQHGGNIYIYSEPGKGTTFKVYLPAGNAIVLPAENDDTVAEERSLDGHETILIAEDNPQVLDMAKTILEQHGYTVLTAGDGEEALQAIEKFGDAITLLLTDIILPKVNGKEVFEQAQQISGNLRVVYMSGYTSNVIVHRGVLDAGINFLQKPFSVLSLCKTIREVLDNSVSGQGV